MPSRYPDRQSPSRLLETSQFGRGLPKTYYYDHQVRRSSVRSSPRWLLSDDNHNRIDAKDYKGGTLLLVTYTEPLFQWDDYYPSHLRKGYGKKLLLWVRRKKFHMIGSSQKDMGEALDQSIAFLINFDRVETVRRTDLPLYIHLASIGTKFKKLLKGE